jgi:hypothetical protein
VTAGTRGEALDGLDASGLGVLTNLLSPPFRSLPWSAFGWRDSLVAAEAGSVRPRRPDKS